MDISEFDNKQYSKDYLIELVSSKFTKFRFDHREKENRNNEGWRNSEYYRGKVNGTKYLIKITQNLTDDQWILSYISRLY